MSTPRILSAHNRGLIETLFKEQEKEREKERELGIKEPISPKLEIIRETLVELVKEAPVVVGPVIVGPKKKPLEKKDRTASLLKPPSASVNTRSGAKTTTLDALVDRAIKIKQLALEKLIVNALTGDKIYFPKEAAEKIIRKEVSAEILTGKIVLDVSDKKPLNEVIDSQFELFFMEKTQYTRKDLEALKLETLK